MTIDAHQHFWNYHPVKDAWITEDMKVLQRDFLPDHLKVELMKNDVDGTVVIQADQSLDETNYLISLSERNHFIKGVVGWVDLQSSTLEAQLQQFSEHPILKGFRHILQAEPMGFMTTKAFVSGVKNLSIHGYTYDLLTTESQLEEAYEFLRKTQEVPIVIDHISKPDIKSQSYSNWEYYMSKISEFPNVRVKLSGLATEANWQTWTPDLFKRYVEACLEFFGPKRLMWGSDWPVCLLAGDYKSIKESIVVLVKTLSTSEQNQIFGETANEFYQLNV